MNTTAPQRPTRMAPPPGGAANAVQTLDNDGRIATTRQTVIAPAAPVAKAYPPKIAAAILKVSRGLKPVPKSGFNDFHKYNYRKFEDVFEELVPLINDAGLIIQQSELTHGNVLEGMIAITYQFTIISEDGDVWPDRPEITAICKVKDHKGMQDDKAASKCNTQAQKYFYTGFFKIRSVDVNEADADAATNAGRPSRRAVPSPTGEMKPHFVAIVNGEHPSAWADRFKKMLSNAKTVEDVDAWYAANKTAFDKIETNPEFADVSSDLIDAMDRRTIEIASGDQQQAQDSKLKQAVQEAATSDFPGDKPIKSAVADAGDIPAALRRTAPTPPATITAADQRWLDDLEAEYGSCNTVDELASVQDSLMMPAQEHVSKAAYEQAKAKTLQHMQRVEAANG
jgi:hypothetical protein